jgi:hypothetical protein
MSPGKKYIHHFGGQYPVRLKIRMQRKYPTGKERNGRLKFL